MGGGRGWLTRDEIQNEARKVNAEAMTPIRDEMARWQDEVRKTLADITDVSRDGAQASIYSATILHGDPSLGIEGAIPNIQSRLKALEARADAQDDKIEEHHRENRIDAEKVKVDLDDVKKSQHRTVRFLSLITRAFFLDEKGNPEWKRIWAIVVSAVGAAHLLLWPGASFTSAKRLVLFINHLMGN